MKNTTASASRSSIIATIFAMAIVTPIVETSRDTHVGVWHNDMLAVIPAKALCIFTKEERKLIAANVVMRRMPYDLTAHSIERAITLKDILGIERNDAENYTMSLSGEWRGSERRCAVLRAEFTWDPIECSDKVSEYIRDIEERLETPIRISLRKIHLQKAKDARDFTPYEDTIQQPVPLEDDGTVCSDLSETEPDFAGIPENDGSCTSIHPDKIVLPTGQTLVKIKYRSRTRYILLDEGFVSEDTTLPEIVGDLERQALHLGVNIWTDRLQRLRDIRKIMVERWLNDEPIGAADLVVAMDNKHPYHIVYSDLRLIRKIRWPDGLDI